MAPARRKGRGAAAAAAAAEAAAKWKVGDLVLAKMKGFPAWPAMISEPEKWGLSATKKKVLVYFYGTKQVAFCNYADIEAFTEEKKKSLRTKGQGKSADFVRAVEEIIDIYESLMKDTNVASEDAKRDDGNVGSPGGSKDLESNTENQYALDRSPDSIDGEKPFAVTQSERCVVNCADVPTSSSVRKRRKEAQPQNCYMRTRLTSSRRLRSSTVPQKSEDSSEMPNNDDFDSSEAINSLVDSHNALEKVVGDAKSIDTSCSTAFIRNPVSDVSKISGVVNSSNNLNIGKLEQTLKNDMFDAKCSENDVKLNERSDMTMNTVTFRRKRKTNRIRSDSSVGYSGACSESYAEPDLSGNFVESPSFRNEANKSDGDDHLPLVKRARVRMGRASTDDSKMLDHDCDIVSKEPTLCRLKEKPDINNVSSTVQICCKSNGLCRQASKESSSSPPMVSSVLGSLSGKSDDCEQNVQTLDGEAALPPLKRINRALEAMSANAVEIVHHNSGVQTPLDTSANGLIGSQSIDLRNNNTQAVTEVDMKPDVAESSKLASRSYNEELALQNIQLEPLKVMKFQKGHDTLMNGYLSNLDDDKKLIACALPSENLKSNGLGVDAKDSTLLTDRLSSSLEELNHSNKSGPSGYTSCVEEKVSHQAVQASQLNSMDVDGVPSSFAIEEPMVTDRTVCMAYTASASDCSLATKSSSIQSDAQTRSYELHACPVVVPKEISHKLLLKDVGLSPDSKPMKDLIAAAQAKRLSRSTSFPDHHVDLNYLSEAAPNFSRGSGRASGSAVQSQLDKLSKHDEEYMARRDFESSVAALTGTKESITRATRFAMDCAKFGIAGEVIDIIIENLDKESNLPKRVDLFFLVDSILKWCRNQKGGAGDVYPSLIESVLPRLLGAAAPPGNAAWENRRQCLKVLKLWLERKILPEYIIRRHIRELNSFNEAAFGSSSCRPLRTERALDDPLRENEGMLVDEYGSNAGFQIPDLLSTKVLEDEEGSSSEERNFEAVTPERGTQACDEVRSAVSSEKHHQVLEEVDGELEMEDVAPLCEAQPVCATELVESDPNCIPKNKSCSGSIPPLPDDRPPSPPPLPASPPPLMPIPSGSTSQLPIQHASAQKFPDPESHQQAIGYTGQNQQPIHNAPMTSHPVQYENSRYEKPLNPAESHGNFPMSGPIHPGNNCPPHPCGPLPNNAYHVRPPPPAVSNQFAYVQPEPPRQRAQHWGNCPPYPERSRYDYDDRGRHYGERDTWGPYPHEFERGRHTPPYHRDFPDRMHPEMYEGPPPPHYYRPPSGPPHSSHQRHGWSMHPRRCNYSLPSSRHAEPSPVSRSNRGRHMGQFSRVNRGRGNWP